MIAIGSLNLVRRHMKEKYGWDMTDEELQAMPHHEQVWEWWRALSYFQLNNHFEKLEDAPEGIEWVSIMDESMKQYQWVNGKYVFQQDITKELCKEVYGN